MTPQKFPQATDSIVQNEIEIPFAEVGNEYISCWQLTEHELALLNKNGGVFWMFDKADPWVGISKMSVHDPFKKLEPLIVDELIADRVIMHQEDGEEIIILKLETGEMIQWAKMFKEPVQLLGTGMEKPNYLAICKRYNIDPWMAIFFKRKQ